MKLSNTTTALKPEPKKGKGGKSPIKQKNKQTITSVNTDGRGQSTVLKSKSELFLTAISTFAGEDTFYESGQDRIERVRELTHKITESDPEWVERFVAWLRGKEVNIRTISLIIAAEYVAAGGENGRKVIASVCQRADEPAEILAYWMQQYYGWDNVSYPLPSPKLPQALRKGLADATNSLYNEYTLLKYDGNSRGVGMASVINLVHPKAPTPQQRAIYKYIVDSEYGNEPSLDGLPMVKNNLDLRQAGRDAVLALSTNDLRDSGITWEQLGGLLQGPWTAEAWEKIIPTMGYMALLRNLRNFEGARISKKSRDFIISKLTDPQQVANSRQLPFRFLSAYKNTNSDAYSAALGEALDLSVKNIPAFQGRTLVLVDKSGSMDNVLTNQKDRKLNNYNGYGADYRSRPQLWEVGALFGVALALKGENVDLAIFGTSSRTMELPKGSSVLRGVEFLRPNHGVGHGTDIWGSVRREYDGHDRIVIFTDMQDNHRSQGSDLKKIPFIHYFDIGGYGDGAPLVMSGNGRYQYGGFSDATFKLMSLLEHQDGSWPF